MKTTFATGRNYNGQQVLTIVAPDLDENADLYADVIVAFIDASRGIRGTVTLFGAITLDACDLGAAVLAAYDAGAYSLE